MAKRTEEIHCPGCDQTLKIEVEYAYDLDQSISSVVIYKPFRYISAFGGRDVEITCPRCGPLEHDLVYQACDEYPTFIITGIKRRKLCINDTNGDGDCHRCARHGGCIAAGGPF